MDTAQSHYSTGNLMERIETMLASAGTSVVDASPKQMAAFDQFHLRGALATEELIAMAGFQGVQHLLDVGCGIGGASRLLCTESGCRVTGIDLAQEFIDVAIALTSSQGQSERVTFVNGSALEMPIEDDTFDGAWMQHVNMNIVDKGGLFNEVARVLKPGAKFAMHEILADQADQPHFPVPWSKTPEGSHLAHEPEFRAALEKAGFTVTEWVDDTQTSVDWMNGMMAKMKSEGPPPINVGVLLGPEFPAMAGNANRSMEDGLIRVVMVTAELR